MPSPSNTNSQYGYIRLTEGDYDRPEYYDPYFMVTVPRFPDYAPDVTHSSETIATGENLSNLWNSMKAEARSIDSARYEYRGVTQNSNSFVDEIITRTGQTEPLNDGRDGSSWAPASGNRLQNPQHPELDPSRYVPQSQEPTTSNNPEWAPYLIPQDSPCFAEGTLITLADHTTKPIEQICIGDRVIAFDGDAEGGRGALQPRTVVRLFDNVTTEWLWLSLADGGDAGKEREIATSPTASRNDTRKIA